jgi:predicted DNA-binding protein YlxM (UPF0122 family)
VPLDIERRWRLLGLLDAYAELLTQHQRETLRLHLERDWSYSEIAAAHGVSRTAVYDLVHRTEALLDDYEGKLGLLTAAERREEDRVKLASRLEDLHGELSRLRKTVRDLS